MKVQIGSSTPWTVYDMANRISNVQQATLSISESYMYNNNGLLDKVTKEQLFTETIQL